MRIATLRLENVRLIEQAEWSLAPHWNVLSGGNGAGKTTWLEAAYLLSHGRSFRTSIRDVVQRHGSDRWTAFAEVAGASRSSRIGLSRFDRRTEARIDGGAVALGELMHRIAVVCFEPGSHELICGPADTRRRYLDWGVFHVEQDFLSTWQRFQRALKQRNALLRMEQPLSELAPWDAELVRSGERLTAMRASYFDQLAPIAARLLSEFLGELGDAHTRFQPGFDRDVGLEAVLAAHLEDDRLRRGTRRGPQRADWTVTFERVDRREYLSRGQEKLCAFAFVLAQATLYAEVKGEWPVICLDDLSSEVDEAHLERIIGALDRIDAQILLTSTDARDPACALNRPVKRFHVEQGQPRQLL